MNETAIQWLGNKPVKKGGVTWGMPWKKGVLERCEELILKDDKGLKIPVQSWAMAYWPDGSIKWTAHAASFEATASERLYMVKDGSHQAPVQLQKTVKACEFDRYIEVDTGVMVCRLNKNGGDIIREILYGNKLICKGARLVCIREGRHITSGLRNRIEEDFESEVTGVTIEQQGPIRCVVRVQGRHINKSNSRAWSPRGWVPFNLRLYFYAGQESIRFVYTFFYDGNPHSDFIKGLGISFNVPLLGPLYNRYVRLGGDTGLFSESPKNLMTIRTKGKYEELYSMQMEGKPVVFDNAEDAKFAALLDESAVWDSFKLVHDSPDEYVIYKRTKPCCSFLEAARGKRSGGLIYIGCQDGGISATMRDLWQKYPSSMEAEGMAGDTAKLNLWFWPPDSRAMDLRHYDTETHLLSSYEGFDEMRSTPYGIANTSEFTITCHDGMPGNNALIELMDACKNPPLLICTPQEYYSAGVFGKWSLVDRSTPEKAFLEDQLDAGIEFYKNEIEQRRWYGLWNYGDVMHSYDRIRHTWRYDIGGCAWQNTELVPNMWLWYMFLRTGREDIFRMAEAMTRHTSEVDVYHFGEYAGLGSRHNVLHWGCGCKEARISMAGLHRYYYYLTADERTGDIMDEVKDADFTVGNLDPMRAYYPPSPDFKTHVRVGPDVMAFCSNWFTRWERYQDEKYRDKLFKCLEFLKGNPYAFIVDGVYGYDPDKTQLYDFKLLGGFHFMFCFGSQFVWMEMAQALEDKVLDQMIMDLGQYYTPFMEAKEEKLAKWGVPNKNFDMSVYCSGLAAYAAKNRNIPELAREVWDVLLGNPEKSWMRFPIASQEVVCPTCVKPVSEIPWMSTNAISQWAINVIMSLDIIGDIIPEGIYKKYDAE